MKFKSSKLEPDILNKNPPLPELLQKTMELFIVRLNIGPPPERQRKS